MVNTKKLYQALLIIWAMLLVWKPADAQNGGRKISQDSLSVLRSKAISLAGQGKYNESLNQFEIILQLKKKIYPENHPELAHTLTNVGVILKKQGHFNEALEKYKLAAEIYERSHYNNPRKMGTTYLNMGNIFSRQKDIKKAQIYYNKAIELYKADHIKNADRLSSAYNNFGILYDDLNEYELAIQYYKKSIQIIESNEHINNVSPYQNLANTYRKTGQYKKAEKYFQYLLHSEYLKNQMSEFERASPIMNYGVLKLNQGLYKEAKSHFQSVLDIYKKNIGLKHKSSAIVFINLGDLASIDGNYSLSLEYYQKALWALSENFADTTGYSNPEIADVFLKTRFLEILKKKIARLKQMGEEKPAFLYKALENYDLAIDVTKAMRKGYLSEDSKLFIMAEERETYMEAMDLALRLYEKNQDPSYLAKAITYAEGSKASVLYEAIQSDQAFSFGGLPDSLKTKETQLNKQIYALEELIFEEKQTSNPHNQQIKNWNRRLFELNKEYDELITYIENEYPRFYQLKYNMEEVNLEHIRKNLNPDEILLEYVMYNNTIYAFQIEKDQLHIKKMPYEKDFHEAIYKLREALSGRNFSTHQKDDFKDFTQTAYDIYSKLIQPLDLDPGKKLTIIPDDILSYIPFETLITQKHNLKNIRYNRLHYLLYDYEIGYAYSAKVLFNETLYSKKSTKKLAAFAPTYENIDDLENLKIATRQKYREKLYPLKGIKEEAEKITRIITGDVYADNHATEQAFKNHAKEYDILHLAMHTIMNDKDPMYSKMAFTQKDNDLEDGFLNTYEIYNLNLSSRLTVLSSCNTGTGKLRKGEGVMSLARGFKYAGCPSIVMTLWPVEDNSSVRLMEYFYEAVKKGKSKDEALRYAKLTFLETADQLHAHPYFWSGYILIGDKTPIYSNYFNYYLGGGLILLLIAGTLFYSFRRKKQEKNTL